MDGVATILETKRVRLREFRLDDLDAEGFWIEKPISTDS
jgi:hypothetical protein